MSQTDQTAPQSEKNAEKSDQPDVTEIREEVQRVNRRSMFGAGFLGLATVIAQACSGTDFVSSSGDKRKKGEKGPSDGNDGFDAPGGVDGLNNCEDLTDSTRADCEEKGGADYSDGGEGDIGLDDSGDGADGNNTDLSDCDAYSTNKIDTTGMAELAEKPTVKFYGRMDSALVAMKFDGSLAIEQVIIATPTGKILALHGITGADKKGNDFRPIVVDNIWLKEKGADISEIHIILQMGTERKLHKEPISFFTTYNNMPVKDLSSLAIPPNWMTNQSVTQFQQVDGSYNADTNVTYPNDFNTGTVRNLQTVKQSSSWVKQAGIKGTVTDIMGDTINIDGSAIIEYQIFCTYVTVGAEVYRTILHIG